MHKPQLRRNGRVIAERDRCEVPNGNQRFPPDDVQRQDLEQSESHTVCRLRGWTSFFRLSVADERDRDAVWIYTAAKADACRVPGYDAFWPAVTVEP